MRASRPKALLTLCRKSLFLRSLATFGAVAAVREVVLMVPRGYEREFARRLPRGSRARIVLGGRRRQDSVARGLAALSPGVDVIVVHDTARPLVTARTVRAVIAQAARHGACICAAPASDTIKRVRGGSGVVAETLDRATLWHAQTPQAFRARLMRRAFALAARRGWEATDCAGLVERAGGRVRVLEPDRPNPKVTHPEDLAVLSHQS